MNNLIILFYETNLIINSLEYHHLVFLIPLLNI